MLHQISGPSPRFPSHPPTYPYPKSPSMTPRSPFATRVPTRAYGPIWTIKAQAFVFRIQGAPRIQGLCGQSLRRCSNPFDPPRFCSSWSIMVRADLEDDDDDRSSLMTKRTTRAYPVLRGHKDNGSSSP
ncbi:hypothetical protein BD779DRAFT_163157 [Infundibulicybe gibba]|nr:hypothetical protein BD779DRAFT_163157 [Infundibulicybe gibba]